MTEKRVVVSGLKLSYSGLFNLEEFYAVFERFIKEMGYDKKEVQHDVKVFEDEKVINLDLRPTRTVSDYVQFLLVIKFNASKVRDVIVNLDGKDVKLQKGDVSVTFNGYVFTDLEGKWMSNALTYFFRVIIDKYIYAGYIKDFDSILKDDVNTLYTEMSSYLNINKYRFSGHA